MLDLLYRSLFLSYVTLESSTWIPRETVLRKRKILHNIQFLVFFVVLHSLYFMKPFLYLRFFILLLVDQHTQLLLSFGAEP